MRRWRAATAAAALLLVGCAPLGSPSAGSTRTSTPAPGAASGANSTRAGASTVATAQATHEYPSPAPPESVTTLAASPVAAVRAFASAYINWTAATVSRDMAALAAQSVGQARSAMVLAAGQTAQDYELQRGGVANQGSVEAVAPLSGSGDQFVVVTLERTTATASGAYAGLRPAWHVALATVTQVAPDRWAVSSWQPQS